MVAFQEGHLEPGWPSPGTFGPYTAPSRPLGNAQGAELTVPTARQQMLGSGCGLQEPYTDNEAVTRQRCI